MAEFVEVIRQKDRICNSYDCNECPLKSGCMSLIVNEPEKAEQIIMEWAKEHPSKTNADKFKEVFGVEAFSEGELGCNGIKCPNKTPCGECEYKKFWSQEYKERKE